MQRKNFEEKTEGDPIAFTFRQKLSYLNNWWPRSKAENHDHKISSKNRQHSKNLGRCSLLNVATLHPNKQELFRTRKAHFYGGFGFYKGRPTAIGGMLYPDANLGFTETLTENGWKKLDNHPM